MDLHNLKRPKGAHRKRKRIGRGPGSGYGKTAGRGTKGQQSRSGYRRRPGFEGGQMPLIRRVPKRGFHNPFREVYQVVNVEALNTFRKGSTVDFDKMVAAGLVKRHKGKVKILGKGELKKELTVVADAFSKSAKEKIESLGGKAEVFSS